MRLTVSPKAAIQKIDSLVREGAALQDQLWNEYELADKQIKEQKQAEDYA
ncbi:MAG: hypothetical protein ABIG34_04840 [Candidatus Peregrinibacteria bacterium]